MTSATSWLSQNHQYLIQKIEVDLCDMKISNLVYNESKDELSFNALEMKVWYSGDQHSSKELLQGSLNLDIVCLKVISLINDGTVFSDISWTLSSGDYSNQGKWIEVQIIKKGNESVPQQAGRIKLPVEGENAVFSFETGQLNIKKINDAVAIRFKELQDSFQTTVGRGISQADTPNFFDETLTIPQLKL